MNLENQLNDNLLGAKEHDEEDEEQLNAIYEAKKAKLFDMVESEEEKIFQAKFGIISPYEG